MYHHRIESWGKWLIVILAFYSIVVIIVTLLQFPRVIRELENAD